MPIEEILASAVGRFRNSLICQYRPSGDRNNLFLQSDHLFFLCRTQLAPVLLFDLPIVFRDPGEKRRGVERWNIGAGQLDRSSVLLLVALFAVLRFGDPFEFREAIPPA